MKAKDSIGVLLPVIILTSLILLTIYGFWDAGKHQSLAEKIQSFMPAVTLFLGGVFGYYISHLFFYRTKIEYLNDNYFRLCKNYEKFLEKLKDLNDPAINRLLLDIHSTTDAPNFCIFDSDFIQLAEGLSTESARDRKIYIKSWLADIKPRESIEQAVHCTATNCDGLFNVRLQAGENTLLTCEKCGARYQARTINHKIQLKSLPNRSPCLHIEDVKKDLPNFLIRNKLDIDFQDLRKIAKAITVLFKTKHTITPKNLEANLRGYQDLPNQLLDPSSIKKVTTILITSHSFYSDKNTKTFLGFAAAYQIDASEELIYFCILSSIAYKLLTQKLTYVSGKLLEEIIDTYLDRTCFHDVQKTVADILFNIKSADLEIYLGQCNQNGHAGTKP